MFSLRTKWSILRALLTGKSPYYIQFYLTGRCHLRCRQCNIVEANSACRELSLDEIAVVADNIRRIGGGIVLLTGGEPFLRKDVDQVAAIFIQRGLDVRLQTAGLASDEQLRRCYDIGVRDINISLDSLDGDKQDYINAVSGSWGDAIDAIERVSRIFRGDSAICSLGCVLSRFNYREIPAILEFATSIGWYLSLVPVHITSPQAFRAFRSYDSDFTFRPEDIPELRRVIERVIAAKRNGQMLFDSESYLRSIIHFAETGRPTWRRGGVCDCPDLYFVVRPNGEFAPCCDYFLDSALSLADPNFWRAYKSGEISRLVAPIKAKCEGCHYGSFPEVTLSVRDLKAFLQRAWLVLGRTRQIIKPIEQGALVGLAESIRKQFPEAYGAGALAADLAERVAKWGSSEGQMELVQEDRYRRMREQRVRQTSRGR